MNKTTLYAVRSMFSHYIFLVQCVFGLTGNVLILIVLMSPKMRKKTSNVLLAALALSDVSFLSSMALLNWASSLNLKNLQSNILALNNWFSVSSSWFVVTVSCERLFAITHPLRVRYLWTIKRLGSLVISIFVASCALTFQYHFGSTIANYALISRIGRWSHNVLGTVVPNIVLVVVNVALVYKLKSQRFMGDTLTSSRSSHQRQPEDVTLTPRVTHSAQQQNAECHRGFSADDGVQSQSQQSCSNGLQSQLTHNRINDEHKITMLVLVIAVFYTVTHAPSVIVFLLSSVFFEQTQIATSDFRFLCIITNSLVVTGKACNFVLFCVASASFRGHLAERFCISPKEKRQKSFSSTPLKTTGRPPKTVTETTSLSIMTTNI